MGILVSSPIPSWFGIAKKLESVSTSFRTLHLADRPAKPCPFCTHLFCQLGTKYLGRAVSRGTQHTAAHSGYCQLTKRHFCQKNSNINHQPEKATRKLPRGTPKHALWRSSRVHSSTCKNTHRSKTRAAAQVYAARSLDSQLAE